MKGVWSQRYLNFNSNTPLHYKKSALIELIIRAVKLSHPKSQPDNLNTIKEVLKSNNYPESFYEPIIRKIILDQIDNGTNKTKPFEIENK